MSKVLMDLKGYIYAGAMPGSLADIGNKGGIPMDFTEISKKYEDCRKECKEHFEKAQKRELDDLFLRLSVNDFFKEHNENDFSFSVTQKNGQPQVACSGSIYSMAFSAYLLMSAMGDFWHMFDIVMAIYEFMYCNAEVKNTQINCDNKEQLDILSKLQSMSPEELSALKEKIVNGPEES